MRFPSATDKHQTPGEAGADTTSDHQAHISKRDTDGCLGAEIRRRLKPPQWVLMPSTRIDQPAV